MELARISLNLSNPAVRRDLTDPYEMHSTLARAFVANAKDAPSPFLWRNESVREGESPILLVQSERAANWDAIRKTVSGWAGRIDVRKWEPEAMLTRGMPLQFRLYANPTVTRQGKRLGLWREDEQRAWFARQAEKAGLDDAEVSNLRSERLVGRRRKDGGATVTVCAALFDGTARVADERLLAAAIRQGLGHARMLGLGLLSVAPPR